MNNNRLENYKMKSEPIGKGNFSSVYLAEDIKQQCEVAIKVSSHINMTKHEAFIMESYGNHPFLPKFYEFFIKESKAYIVMEYFPGVRIGHWNYHSTGKKRSKEDAILITLNILEGLQRLHQIGFAHHDLLPKNILIMNDNPNRIKLIDFGLAKPLNSEKNQRYKINDLSVAASMCIYLINGVVSKPRIDDLESLEDDLKEVLFKAYHPNIEQRYQSAKEFIKALNPLV